MKAIVLVVMLAGVGSLVPTPDVQVIANPGMGVTELRADEVKDIFLGHRTAIRGVAVQPVFEESGAAHEAFLKTYVGKSDAALRNYFKTLVFTGRGTQPKTFASDADVVKYVAATKGAVGYVSASADISAAKKVEVK